VPLCAGAAPSATALVRRLAHGGALARFPAAWSDAATIPTRGIDLDNPLGAELDENTLRKEFTPSERCEIAEAMEAHEREKAQERQAKAGPKEGRGKKKNGGGNLPQAVETGKSRDIIAARVGWSGKTYDKAKAVVQAAEKDEDYGGLVEHMDRTGNVDAAYRHLHTRAAPRVAVAAAPVLQRGHNRRRRLGGTHCRHEGRACRRPVHALVGACRGSRCAGMSHEGGGVRGPGEARLVLPRARGAESSDESPEGSLCGAPACAWGRACALPRVVISALCTKNHRASDDSTTCCRSSRG
jgi:hypothetical protein